MKEENYRLIKLAQNGDREALEAFVIKNSGLIHSAVKKFSGRGTDNEDLFQIGAMGLIKSINKFDASFGVEFSTYAVPMIMGEIRRFLRDDGMIKVSRKLKETAAKARGLSEKFMAERGCELTVAEIAEMIDSTIDEVTLSLEATKIPESIYKTVHEGDASPVLLLDKLNSDENSEEKVINRIALKNAIKNLPSRERQILALRFYKEKTQSEVARIMGLSQVQISRIEKKVLSGLREKIS